MNSRMSASTPWPKVRSKAVVCLQSAPARQPLPKTARHLRALMVGGSILAAIALKNVHEGSATQCYVATHPSLESVSGEFFADCNIQKPSRHARNEAMAERLYEVTEQIVAGL